MRLHSKEIIGSGHGASFTILRAAAKKGYHLRISEVACIDCSWCCPDEQLTTCKSLPYLAAKSVGYLSCLGGAPLIPQSKHIEEYCSSLN